MSDSNTSTAPLSTLNTEDTTSTATQPAPSGTFYANAPKETGITNKIALDSNETKEILARMQEFIDQRQSPLALLMGGINKAYATTYGPSAALEYEKFQNLEDKQIMDYRTQMAAYRAAQSQAERDAALYASRMKPGAGPAMPAAGGAEAAPTSGASVGVTPEGVMIYGGIPVPDSMKARLKGNAAHDLPILDKWLETRTTESIKKEMSPSMAAVVDVFGVGPMTVAQAEQYLNKLPHLQALVNGKQVPLATVVADAQKATPPAAAPTQATKPMPAPVPGAPAPAAAPATAATTKPAPAAAPAEKPPAAPATIKPSQVIAGPPEPPIASNYIGRQPEFVAAREKWQKEIDTYNEIRKDLAKSGIASIKEEADKFIARTEPNKVAVRQGENDYLKQLIQKWYGNDTVAGIFNDPTWGNALATAFQKGVQTPGGAIAMPDITEVIQRVKPDASKEEIEASKELARLLGQRILNVVQQSKGSTSDRDWSAFEKIAGTVNNGWDALYKIQRYDEEALKVDKQQRSIFEKTYNGQTFDYNKYLVNPERKALDDDLLKKLTEINQSKFVVQKTPPRPKDVPAGAMYNPTSKEWGWYDNNKKWNTKK